MIGILRFFLFPFSFIYGFVLQLRNFFYDKNLFSSYKIPIPSIVVGNLSTGGTGKTPHTAYLINLLSGNRKIAILSRGYGRKTHGFIEVNASHSFQDVGDEPLQFFLSFGEKINVFVCENRKIGVEKILKNYPNTEVLLLDDAFQHRRVNAGFSILLSEFKKPFFKDFVLPTGNLREFRKGKKRSDCCIYTKCSKEISNIQKQDYSQKFDPQLVKNSYFSHIDYGAFSPLSPVQASDIKNILLVCGIANPRPLERHLEENYHLEKIFFSDHHAFNQRDLEHIHKKFDNFAQESKIILTTEKDMVRLKEKTLWEKIQHFPWYYIPIKVKIDNEKQFNQEILNYVEKAERNN